MVSPVVKSEPTGILTVNTTPPKPQLSETVGGVQFRIVSHLSCGRKIRMGSDGQFAKTGAVPSVTVIVKVQVAEFPRASVAVYVMICGATCAARKLPEAGTEVIERF